MTPFFEVIVPFASWRQALMPMLTQGDLVATGTLRRDPRRQPTVLLVGELTTRASPPTGADFSPLADWIAVASPPGEPPEAPDAWVRRLRPCFAQLLVVLLVGLGRDRRSWRGWATERGAVWPLAGFRVVGPGMVHATAHPAGDDYDGHEDARWTRLRGAVGEAVFRKLREARVAVIGCSRTGTLAAGMFAALGVRGLTLIDSDALEPHNLDGMLLSRGGDLGANKAVALGRRLVAFRPDLLVKAVPGPAQGRTVEQAAGGADRLVTCVDQDGPRLHVAHWAHDGLVPHLDVGAGVTRTAGGGRQLAADVRLLLPRAGCVRCVGGLADLDQAEYELHAPPGALPRRPPEPWNARGRLGSLVTLNSQAVSAGVQSWLDLLEGTLTASVWHRLRWSAGGSLEMNSALVGAGETCPLCGRPPG
jgi:hypothetical protein